MAIIAHNGTWKSRKVKFLVREMGFQTFLFVFKSKFGVKTPLNKKIFETFNLRICPLVLCP